MLSLDNVVYVSRLRYDQLVSAILSDPNTDVNTKRNSDTEFLFGDITILADNYCPDSYGIVLGYVDGKRELVGMLNFTNT